MHDTADNTAPAAEHAASPAKPRLSADTKWIMGTGMTIVLLLISLVGIMIQQTATINSRIDDINNTIHTRIGDTNNNVRELRTEMHAMRADLQTEIRERHADLQTEIRERHADLQTDIRELRGMLLQLLERTEPASPVD